MAINPPTPEQRRKAFEVLTMHYVSHNGVDPYNTADKWLPYHSVHKQVLPGSEAKPPYPFESNFLK